MRTVWLGILLFITTLIYSIVVQAYEVGSIAGSFDVTLSGSSVYSIPIRTAPGTAGTAPKISITYDSQASSGPLGAGWSITGISTITRGPKSFYTDHTMSGINLDDSDALFFDGQRLIQINKSGTGKNRRIEYRKEVDDLTQIIQFGDSLNTSVFTIKTKGGVILEFNGANGSNIKVTNQTDERILAFAVSRILDTAGNYIDFFYNSSGNGNYDISKIKYTGHDGDPIVSPYATIDFEYENINRSLDSYVSGFRLHRDSRLKSITSSVSKKPENTINTPSQTVAKYSFEYSDTDTANRFVLRTVHQFGENGEEITPTKFSYSMATIGWSEAKYQIPIDAFAKRANLTNAYRFTHFSKDNRNLSDLLFSAKINGTIESHAYQNNEGKWVEAPSYNPPIAFVSDDGSDLGVLIADLNGDGRSDILQSNFKSGVGEESSVFLVDNDKWQKSEKYKLPFHISENGKQVTTTKFIKFTSGPGPDLLYSNNNKSGFLANTSDGWKEDLDHSPPLPLSEKTLFLDVNCDGTPEFVSTNKNSNNNLTWMIFRYDEKRWIQLSDAKFNIPIPADINSKAIQEIDLNKDGCKDLIVSSASVKAAYIATPDGWKSSEQKLPSFLLVTNDNIPTDAIVVDVDKDGWQDVIAHKILPLGEERQFAYRQTENGWEATSDKWTIPILARADIKDISILNILTDIDGDGIIDIIQPSNSQTESGKIYAGNGKGYIEKPQLSPEIAFATKVIQDRGIRLMDLDADGLLDIVFRRDKHLSKS